MAGDQWPHEPVRFTTTMLPGGEITVVRGPGCTPDDVQGIGSLVGAGHPTTDLTRRCLADWELMPHEVLTAFLSALARCYQADLRERAAPEDPDVLMAASRAATGMARALRTLDDTGALHSPMQEVLRLGAVQYRQRASALKKRARAVASAADVEEVGGVGVEVPHGDG